MKTASEYIEAGNSFDADGWTVTLDDSHLENLPVAVHQDTGAVMPLEWAMSEDDAGNPSYWNNDWQTTDLDYHWGDAPALIAELEKLHEAGRLRVANAIYGMPGASKLGALLC